MNRLLNADACEQAAAVRAGNVTAAELVHAAIARIEARNPRINAVIIERFTDAVAEADSASGPFAGVPVLVKDAGQELAGVHHFVGTPVLRDAGYTSPTTTSLVATLQRLGFVVLGKTNVPELSAGVSTEPAVFGPTRNPWDVSLTAGGSSGGSAAAVAAGLVAVAHGADGTGSLRYPASACGVATLKPSRGRLVSTPPAGQPDQARVWAEFFLTRSVRDLQALLAALAPSEGREDARASESLRVGLLLDDPLTGLPVDAACLEAVAAAGQLFERLGHHVEVEHPPALDDCFRPIAAAVAVGVGAGRAAQVRWLEERVGRPLREGDLDAGVLEQARRGARFGAGEMAEAREAIDRAMSPVRDWWLDRDLLMTPTLRQPPWPLGQDPGPGHSGVFPVPFSFTGQPAMSLPLHRTDAGLPIGVQLVMAVGEDERLLQLAAQLEAAAPWPTVAP